MAHQLRPPIGQGWVRVDASSFADDQHCALQLDGSHLFEGLLNSLLARTSHESRPLIKSICCTSSRKRRFSKMSPRQRTAKADRSTLNSSVSGHQALGRHSSSIVHRHKVGQEGFLAQIT